MRATRKNKTRREDKSIMYYKRSYDTLNEKIIQVTNGREGDLTFEISSVETHKTSDYLEFVDLVIDSRTSGMTHKQLSTISFVTYGKLT